MCEDALGVIHFYQFSHQEKCAFVADAGRLLHVVRYDDHGVFLLQLCHQLFNLHGAGRGQSTGGFIHQNHFRFHSQRTGNAKTLLHALERTANKRGSRKVLEIYPDIIAEIRASDQLRGFWKKYQRDFDYAKDISFDDACDTVQRIMDSITE